MSTTTVRFLFDVGSPNAYLAHKVIPAVEARTGARFEYVPILLGGLFKLANNRSPVEAYREVPTKLAYERLEMQRFVARHGLDAFRWNPHFPVNTLRVMRGAVAADALGCFAAYVDAVFAGMWERGLDLADPSAIVALLDDAKLDAAALVAASEQPEVKARLAENTQAAYAQGAFGSPSFLIGDELWFGKERLGEIENELVRRAGVAPG